MDLNELFKEIRQSCPANIWSKGVELARRKAVAGVSSEDNEIICRVKLQNRVVPCTVQLYPEDVEWDCDCGTRLPCCEHVAGTVIAVKNAHGEGQELPTGGVDSARLVYRLAPVKGQLNLRRVLVRADGSESELTTSLASAIARNTTGMDLSPAQSDLNLDRLLGSNAGGPLHHERVAQVLKILSSARNVELNKKPVRISSVALKPVAKISDRPDGGFIVELDRPPELTEILAPGVALAGESIHPLASPKATGLRLEQLPNRKEYPPAEVSVLVTEVLPELKRRMRLEVATERLPELTSDAKPRIQLQVEQQGSRLSLLAAMVYGDPPIARVDGQRLVHLDGPVPIRNSQQEQRAAERVRRELNLVPGKRLFLDGDAATAMAERLENYSGQIAGVATKRFIHSSRLAPRLDAGDGNTTLHFTAQGADPEQELRADPQQVMRAWREGQSLVPLLGGGWAPLPSEWLERHAELLESVLAARNELTADATPAYLKPALAALYAELDTPPPAELAPVAALLRGMDTVPQAELPKDLKAELRDYQLKGVSWLQLMRHLGLGATLADDMGLGKTLQTLSVLKGRCLVVAPTSVMYNWAMEAEKFRPGLRVNLYHGKQRKLDPSSELTLTTYAILRLDQEALSETEWDVAVLDEAQTIKNPESQAAQAAYRLKAHFRITLSGTPVENRLEELWSQFHFTNPGLLGGRADFQGRYSDAIAQGEAGAAKRLRGKIGPFLLRRDKRSVAPELPPRSDIVLHCELSPGERELYGALAASTQREVVERLREGGSVMKALEALLRLRQAACHPSLLPGRSAESSAKVERLLNALSQVHADGHRALVFSQWTSFLDLVEEPLRTAGIRYGRLDGSTRDRQGVVEQFQTPDGPEVLLLSLKAGGTGLNLTAADHVFLLDLWWNPAVEQQAADRAHRIGQQNPVFVYRLVAKDTVEERILALQNQKRELADAVLGEADQATSLTREDLLGLLEG